LVIKGAGFMTKEELELKIWRKCSACSHKRIVAGMQRRRCKYKSVGKWLEELERRGLPLSVKLR